MSIAGFDPNSAVPFWERMSSQQGSAIPEFMRTHPSDAKRIAEIKKCMPEAMEYYNAVMGNTPSAPANTKSSSDQWKF